MSKTKVAVFITAYNEEKTIGDVLSLIDDSYDTYVIDDGSNDKTIEIAQQKNAQVIRHPINLGQGVAVITAFKFFLDKDYDIIIEMDGDGQHDPKEIPRFINKMQETGADIIAGSRILGANYKGAPLARRMFLAPLTWLLNKLTGYSVSDSMCGFRAFRGAALKKFGYLFDNMFEPEYIASEMWIKFSKVKLTVANVPITLADRKHGSSYKGLFRYGWGVISTIIRAELDINKHVREKND